MSNNKRKLLLILLFFTLTFGFFLWFVFGSSGGVLKDKIVTISAMSNPDSIVCYYMAQEESLKKNSRFKQAVIKKLKLFDLSQQQLDNYSFELGVPEYMNFVIVPDLSDRIEKAEGQIEKDRELILKIYDDFIDAVKTSKNHKNMDRLQFDFTNPEDAKKKFGEWANDIAVDFAKHPELFEKEKIKRKRAKISKGIKEIYAAALEQEKFKGDDYVTYLQDKILSSQLPHNTLEARWVNKIILLTDGYLIAENQKNYTNEDKQGRTQIPTCGKKFNHVDMLVCEVDPKGGKKGNIARAVWKDWLSKLEFRNITENKEWWFESKENIELIKGNISTFLQPMYNEKPINCKSEVKEIKKESSLKEDNSSDKSNKQPEPISSQNAGGAEVVVKDCCNTVQKLSEILDSNMKFSDEQIAELQKQTQQLMIAKCCEPDTEIMLIADLLDALAKKR